MDGNRISDQKQIYQQTITTSTRKIVDLGNVATDEYAHVLERQTTEPIKNVVTAITEIKSKIQQAPQQINANSKNTVDMISKKVVQQANSATKYLQVREDQGVFFGRDSSVGAEGYVRDKIEKHINSATQQTNDMMGRVQQVREASNKAMAQVQENFQAANKNISGWSSSAGNWPINSTQIKSVGQVKQFTGIASNKIVNLYEHAKSELGAAVVGEGVQVGLNEKLGNMGGNGAVSGPYTIEYRQDNQGEIGPQSERRITTGQQIEFERIIAHRNDDVGCCEKVCCPNCACCRCNCMENWCEYAGCGWCGLPRWCRVWLCPF